MMEPPVSVPTANPTRPAAVADAGPADDPPEPRVVSHGFLVRPPNQTSPIASSPVVSFASRTAPASRMRSTAVASISATRSLYGFAPQVVRMPLVAYRSLIPYGIPCRGPL